MNALFKNCLPVLGLATSLTVHGADIDDWIDQLDQRLTHSFFEDRVRTRLSGIIDLEGYRMQAVPTTVLESSSKNLFVPRLTLFLDAQLGSKVYAFTQFRADRGFDPGDYPPQARVDEYAVRFTPWEDGRFSVQAGKFGTVIGNWMQRHVSWDNPFVSVPLPYEQITGISDSELAGTVQDLAHVPADEVYDHVPLIWGPAYATGIMAAGRVGMLESAVEIKNSAVSSRPATWDSATSGFETPSVQARIGLKPNPAWNFGFSVSDGSYRSPESGGEVPATLDRGDFRQQMLAQDFGFAWKHLQIWAEIFEARFAVPGLGDADTVSGYIEAKYKLGARWYLAGRWNQQFYGTMPVPTGGELRWGDDVRRFDLAIGFRPLAHTQIKLQWSLLDAMHSQTSAMNSFAVQFSLKF